MGFIRNSIIGAAGVGITAAGFFAFDNTTRNDSGEIIESGEIGVFSIEVGDCLTDFPDITELSGESVSEGLGVPCSTPHQYEVFYETFFEDSATVAEIEAAAEEVCLENFEPYVGVEYILSSLYLTTFVPSSESWAEGDREISCLITSMDGSLLTGSAKNSGL